MIFVDTSAWVAVLLEKDQHHKSAARVFQKLISLPKPLVTTDFVISETYTYLRYHTKNFQNLLKFEGILSEAEAENLLALKWTRPEIFREARKIFFKYSDQRFSFVDCISFATIQALNVQEVFTFDEDFRIMGFHLIPPY